MERIPALILSSAIAAATALTWQSPARAQDESSLAMEIFEAGSAYYKQGDYDKALEQFEEAYRLDPLPELLYNIGQCHERLQDYTDAIDAYSRYLEQDPAAQDRQAVEQKIKNLQQKLEMTGIVLDVSEQGAQVLVDGEPAGTSPVESFIHTQPGSHELEVVKEGFQTSVTMFTVPPGITQEIQVTLVPQPPDEPDPATWFYWTYGIAAASGAAAVVTGVLALDKAGDASSTESPTRYDADRKMATRLAVTTDVLIGVAAACVIVSTAGAIVAAKKKKKKKTGASGGDTQVSLTPLASPEFAGLSLQLTY
jgi:tetratricopeptide (TPR) repeat protein